MLVSWNWLKDYVPLDMPLAELEERLSMSGLNHESTQSLAEIVTELELRSADKTAPQEGAKALQERLAVLRQARGQPQLRDDAVIDLEVTSNRPDCLGHIGVAREISVLWQSRLRLPAAEPTAAGGPVGDTVQLQIEAPDMCPQYTARVIRGVKVGPSPDWLRYRLAAVGQPSVNNIVDITNYVMLSCGQPLHAFDLDKLRGGTVIVRGGRPGEQLEAINHSTYPLDAEMCVIADAESAVALAGIMGGAPTEVGPGTTNLLIESAEFDQLTTRNTARQLKLGSDSSYRFERGVDPRGVDWASRWCCALILELAGGELEQGVAVAGAPAPAPGLLQLRLAQLPRVLGISLDRAEVTRILAALGCEIIEQDDLQITVRPPSWRKDCTREIDLIEEVARVHGYEEIPEDSVVRMTASARSPQDRLVARVRESFVGAGYLEAMTVSVVPQSWNDAFNPWLSQQPVNCVPSMLRGADHLRHSLAPSLLQARRYNDSRGNLDARLFETARVYVSTGDSIAERWTLGLVSSQSYAEVKGLLEVVLQRLACQLEVRDVEDLPLLAAGRAAHVLAGGRPWGWLGEVSEQGRKQLKLQRPATIAEVSLDLLAELAVLVPEDQQLSEFPAMEQDLNFIVPEQLRWAELEQAVRQASGPLLEEIAYKETYRDPKDGPQRKRQLFTIVLRSMDDTLTSDAAEQTRNKIEAALAQVGGALVS